jgi:hypothetical protein
MEQAVSRTLRDSLERLQRTKEEVSQAINDLVASCASTRPTNSLPPMLRAQAAAASLSASLEVLSRFVTAALQPSLRTAAEHQAIEALELAPSSPSAESVMQSQHVPADASVAEQAPEASLVAVQDVSTEPETAIDALPETAEPALVSAEEAIPAEDFDMAMLRQEEQDLHRRADRVAKVAMQDIKLLHPDQVRIGREQKDLCARLRGDIEKAYREYDRRFHAILKHPVDHFYDRMVEILGDGDPEALGDYPYKSPVLRH